MGEEMIRDDIIRLAREAGAIQHVYDTNPPGYGPLMFDCAALERFAALVAAAEREACAKVCDEHAKRNYNWASENADIYHAQAHWAARIAVAIRARGEMK